MQLRIFTKIFFIILAFSSFGSAQSIDGKTYELYDSTGVFYRYFKFENDTLSLSSDNVSFFSFATYTHSSNEVWIVDLPAGGCLPSDTGKYNYSFSGDTILFNIINDQCDSRPGVFQNYTWISISPLGIFSGTGTIQPGVYPNPSQGQFQISNSSLIGCHYQILDPKGKILLMGHVPEDGSLDIRRFPKGTYILVFEEMEVSPTLLLKY